VAGTVALGGGLVVARDGDSVSDPFALRAAVTEEPELAWTWDAETGVNMVSPMDQGALVVLRDGAVVRSTRTARSSGARTSVVRATPCTTSRRTWSTS
jgi:hypothetical protein